MIERGKSFDFVSNLAKEINNEPKDLYAARKALEYYSEKSDRVLDRFQNKERDNGEERC